MSHGFDVKVVRNLDQAVWAALKQRLVDAANLQVKVGLPASAHEPDGTSLAVIARANEFGATIHMPNGATVVIPERPFIRGGIRKGSKNFVRLNRVNLIKIMQGKQTARGALGQLGEMAKGEVQRELRHGGFVANAPSTIAAKGSSQPLIDEGNLVQAITYEIGPVEP